MKVYYHRITLELGGMRFDPELYLEPENDRDRKILEVIEAECVTKGCGRTSETLRIVHVRLALTPAEKEEHK